MLKKFKGYLQKGLTTAVTAAVLTGASFIYGCGPGVDPFHEVFRNDEKKNMAPVAEAVEIDYSKYDREKNYQIVEDRAYLKDDVKPNPTLEKIVDVPSVEVFRIPAINATYIEDPNGGIILQYKSRQPAPDLRNLVSPYLKEIKIEPFSNQNILTFSGKKQAFGDFKYLTTLLNQFDLPAMQIRMRLKIVSYSDDNTYDRDLALSILKNKINVLNLNLPSSPDTTTKLATGIDINPFYNQSTENFTLESAIKFLDSYGRTRTVSDVDVATSNGKPADLLNISSIPYPEWIEGKMGFIEALKYRDTGTTIKATPFANDQGFITIKLEKAESGEHTGYYGTFQRPTFSKADLSSEFIVRNGIPYYIATSLFEREKSVKRGLPGINIIPILGDLFSSKSDEKSQSQLLYLFEARVVDRESDVGTQVKKIEERVPARIEGLVEKVENEKQKSSEQNSLLK